MHTSHDDLSFKGMGKEHEQKIIEAIEAGRNITHEPTVQATESNIDKIKKLAELKESGILTEQEFEDKKAQLLTEI
ncbi:SHOCT domain-containing protein [Photobacterium leiognathi]|uniref:SHOCT domain-containing protein n=1 Tax=Photobacterium leiognathi TaxID=553611 RepID=UPI00298297C9|nr:SHOCT domain-containing protein [Photobacterium leiognathi]